MSGTPVDLKLDENSDGFFDLTINDDGDFTSLDGLETSLTVSFFTDRRAAESEVSSPQYRRGWWGNLVKADTDPELGSKIWLLDQSPVAQITLNNAIAHTRNAYQWLIDLDFADRVEVSGSTDRNTIFLIVKIIKDNNIISQQVFDLWQNTVSEINNA